MRDIAHRLSNLASEDRAVEVTASTKADLRDALNDLELELLDMHGLGHLILHTSETGSVIKPAVLVYVGNQILVHHQNLLSVFQRAHVACGRMPDNDYPAKAQAQP
jgi:hypothetical protein